MRVADGEPGDELQVDFAEPARTLVPALGPAARPVAGSERFWLNLQIRYELEVERDRLAGALDQIEPLADALP